MRFLRALILLLALSGTAQLCAQITCDFNFVNTGPLCTPYFINAVAAETSSSPIVQRDWTTTYNAMPWQTGTGSSFVGFADSAGTYCVTLTSENANGEICTITKCINVSASPIVNFTFAPTEGCRGLCVNATCNSLAGGGVINSVQIDWGCITITNLPNCPSTPVTYCYSNCSARPYSPVVIVRNSLGCVASETYANAVNIIPPPVANFSANVTTANCTTSPLPVTFTATNGGPNMTYCWYIDNVLQQCGSGLTFNYTFPINNADCYDIKLVVRHPSGCADSMIRADYICVRQSPQICVTPSSTSFCIASGECHNLTLTNCTPGLNSLTWGPLTPGNYPGGTGPTQSYTICTTGTYNVNVTGTFAPGCTATLSLSGVDTVKPKPIASFTVNDNYSCSAPHTVINTAVPCSLCTYTWFNAGGGVNPVNFTSSTPSETVTYNNYGSFTTTLTVRAPNGCTQTQTQSDYVVVRRLNPVIGIQNQVHGCPPVCPTFVDITNYSAVPDSIVSRVWSFNPPLVPNGSGSPYSTCFDSVGCYDIKLVVRTNTGCVDSAVLNDTVCVGRPPVCTLTAFPPVSCFEDTAVVFGLLCDSFDCAYVDYGDGVTAIVCNRAVFDHIYEDIGVFNTCVIPYRDSCAGQQLCTTVTINPPIARFRDSTSCFNVNSVFLMNESVQADSFWWYFCDGTTSRLQNPVVALPPCDTCTIRLRTHNVSTGCYHEVTRLVRTACDYASMTPTDTIDCVNRNSGRMTVSFRNTSQGTPAATYPRWDPDTVANGLNFGFPGTNPFIWTNYYPGNYVAAMLFQSNIGCRDTVFARVTVCEVDVNFTSNNVCFPDSICFTSNIKDSICTVDSIRWDFGDNSPPVFGIRNVCHRYDTSGIYTVRLYADNNIGCWDTAYRQVIVSEVVDIDYDLDTVICPGTTHSIINNSQGVQLSYVWQIPSDIPYDTFSTTGPDFVISTPGDYWIYVNVSSAGLCTTRDSTLIHVCPPVASGMISDTFVICPNPPKLITFTSTSTCIDSIFWSFGDEVTSDDSVVVHYYEFPGVYNISLRVSTTDGCSDSAYIGTIVVDGPFGLLTVDPDTGMCACKDTVTFTVGTYNATAMTLLFGCGPDYCQQIPISPVGTPSNPTYVTCSYTYPFCLTDSCTAQVRFGDTIGCQVRLNKPLYIDSPTVDFTYNNFGACLNNTVCFFDSTSYHINLPSFQSRTVRWLWDFGDNTTDSVQNPCHVYPGPGSYTVRLYVWSNLGCFDSSIIQTVIIPQFPVAGYYADDSTVCAFTPVCFHDSSTVDTLTSVAYYTWNFGDSATVYTTTQTTICHTYATGGLYRVTHCVYDSLGCPDCDSSLVMQVIDNPVANAGPDDTVCYDVVYTLNGSGAANCLWSPSPPVSNPVICNPTVQLQSNASFQLIVTDTFGCSDTDNVNLTVARVISNFNVAPTGCLSDSVCVTDASTVTNSTLFSWTYDFGDSFTGTGPNVCHKYVNAGTYNVLQTVTDNQGCTDTTVKTVIVFPNPSAAFTIVDPVICGNQPACVTDASTGNSLTWNWNFGLPPNVQGQSPPCRIYPPNPLPNYTITLVVTDVNGCTDTAQNLVTVNQEPTANFNWTPSCENVPMQLSSASVPGDGAITGCNWTWLPSTSIGTGANCNVTYLFPAGSHQVQLVVTDSNLCTDTIVKTVLVDALTNVTINGGDTTICIGSSVSYTVSGTVTNVTWSPNIWIDDNQATTVLITPLGNVSYIVSSVNGACAPATDTVNINVLDTPSVNVTATPQRIIIGLSSNITSHIPAPIDSIVWIPDSTLNCRTCRNPVATPSQTTTYYAYVYYSLNGVTCSTLDSVTIEVINSCDESIVYMPNTFTPNGDGLNDVFMVRGIGITKINYLRIFDRWGKLMKETSDGLANDPRWGWDGTDKQNKKLDPAVFVYTYEIVCVNSDIVSGKGNITLLR